LNIADVEETEEDQMNNFIAY